MLNNKVLKKTKFKRVSTSQVSSVRVSHKYPTFKYPFSTSQGSTKLCINNNVSTNNVT